MTATFEAPGQGGQRQDASLVILDDGSANNFSFSQLGFVFLKCEKDSFGNIQCEELADFLLTSNDVVANDGVFTRGVSFFNLSMPGLGTLVAQDCLALSKKQVPLDITAGEVVDFRIDVVDRAGNIQTWPANLSAPADQTEFFCEGDDCLCCWLRRGTFGGACAGLLGLTGPDAPDGFCRR